MIAAITLNPTITFYITMGEELLNEGHVNKSAIFVHFILLHIFYIYKNECLYVCLSRMRSYTIHPIAMKLR
jgi:hypothetical protein